MKLLLDTHVFLWWASDPAKLSPAAWSACGNPANDFLLSLASVWEMQIKCQTGKLPLTPSLADLVARHQQKQGLALWPVTLEHLLYLEILPPAHKDPFDRMLASQANLDALTLVTADPIFGQYPVTVLW